MLRRPPRGINPFGAVARQETPVGIEPTSTGLQPVAWPSGSSVKYPRQESNLIPDLRRVVCHPPHPEDIKYPAEESNLVLQFRRLPCHPSHPQSQQYPDLES